MVGDSAHRDGEGQQVTRHDENKEDDIAGSDEFAAPFSCEHFTSIGHRRDLRVSQFHLSHDVSGVGCEQAEANKKNDGTVQTLVQVPTLMHFIDVRDKAKACDSSGQRKNTQ